MRQRETAICLRTADFSETSQVVHFLTRSWGVVRLLAKGTKRPKSKSGGAIDLLAEGDLVFTATSRDTLGTLIEFAETVSHMDLRADAARLNTALYMVELVGDMLAEADPHAEVFDLLHNALARLGQKDAPIAAVLAFFQWRMLRHVGLLGELKQCVGCGTDIADCRLRIADSSVTGTGRKAVSRPGLENSHSAIRNPQSEAIYFSSSQGGILCAACEGAVAEKYRLDGAALAGIAALTAVEAGAKVSLPDKQARALNRLLSYHITQQLGKKLKMAKYAIP